MHIDILHSKPVEMLKYDYPSDIEAFHTTIQQIMTTTRNMKYSEEETTSYNLASYRRSDRERERQHIREVDEAEQTSNVDSCMSLSV